MFREEVTLALRRALFEEWAEYGYAAISLERVASRAGVGKAALYRRWPSKLALASDALKTVGVDITPVPDTGSLGGDVRAFLGSLIRVLRHPIVRRVLPDLHAECARGGELAPAQEDLAKARRKLASTVIDRAVERGELSPDVDRAICLDHLAASLYWRLLVVRGSCSRARLDRLAAGITAALRASVI